MPGAFGAEVCGLTSGDALADEATVTQLRRALAEHRVLRVEVPDLEEAQFARLGHAWGKPIAFFNPRDRDARHPELIRITNSPKTPPALRDGAMHWHQDSSYESPPASVTMLHAVEAPDDNDTRFVDLIAVHDALDAGLRRTIRSLVVRHHPGGAHPDLFFPEEVRGESDATRELPEVRHPLVIRHPVTGRSALYGISGTAIGLVDRPEAEALTLLRSLKQRALSGDFEQRARAVPGTILVWDNLAVMHSATATRYSDREGERRLIHRISLRCEASLSPATE